MMNYRLTEQEELKMNTPALLIYEDLVAANIDTIGQMLGGYALLRPHVKTDKIAEVVRMLQDKGVDKFKCATIAEAEMLGKTGAKDVLLAYQPDEVKAKRLLCLINAFPDTRFSCLADNIETCIMLDRLSTENNQRLCVYIDVNVGMNRTGASPERVPELCEVAAALNKIALIGLHVYDGHVEDADEVVRGEKAAAVFNVVCDLRRRIQARGLPVQKLVIAGSPTFKFYHRLASSLNDDTVEVSPGTFTFWDAGYAQLLPDLPFTPAAVLLGRVVSIINGQIICVDLGYKAVASENPLSKRLLLLNVPGGVPLQQSEEHLTIKVPEAASFKVGEPVYAIPWHVCPTVALYESVIVVKGRQIAGEWKVVARNRKISF